jgi:hypothetical protein
MDQAVAGEPFSWTNIPKTHVENWIVGKTFTYFAGRHNGYERLADPVTHGRCVLHLNDGIWLVRDLVLGSAEHELELRWHFASDISVREGGAGELIASRPESVQTALRLIWPEQTAWNTTITRGTISPAYGRYEPAPVVRCEARVKLPAEIATALIAQRRPAQTQDEAHMVSRHEATVQVYELHEGNQSHEFFFALDERAWSSGPWSSNAELLYCRIEEEKLVQLIVVGGDLVAWQGRPILKARRPCQFFEWRKRGGVTHAEPEPVSTTPLFDELTGGLQSVSNTANTTSSYAEKH